MSAALVHGLESLAAFLSAENEAGARADVATLEAAIDVLEAEPIVCDFHERGECRGPIRARACADCGKAIARCEVCGGSKSMSREMFLHRQREHREAT